MNLDNTLTTRQQAAMFARRLFAFYPAQEAGDPKIVLAGVVELFEQYPLRIVQIAVSAAFGLPKKYKFMPRIAEIAEFLEAEMGPVRRQEARDQRVMLPAPEPPLRLTREQFDAKYRDENGRYPWQFREKERPDWSKAAASMVRQMPGFDDIPDAPLQDWGKLK